MLRERGPRGNDAIDCGAQHCWHREEDSDAIDRCAQYVGYCTHGGCAPAGRNGNASGGRDAFDDHPCCLHDSAAHGRSGEARGASDHGSGGEARGTADHGAAARGPAGGFDERVVLFPRHVTRHSPGNVT